MELNPSHPQFSIIKSFIEITSCRSKYLAMLCLEAHNFELEAAVSYFFDRADVNNSDASQAEKRCKRLVLAPQYQSRSPPEYRYSSSEFPPLDSVRDFRSGPRSPSTLSLRPCGSMSSDQRRVGEKGRARDFNGVWDTDPGFNPLEDANDLGRRVRARGQSNEHDGNEIFDRERQSFADIIKSKQCLHPLSSTGFVGTSGLFSELFSSTLQQSEAANLFQSPLSPAPTPPSSQGLIVDPSQPSTLIQIRLFDGTRVIQQFNNSHTIQDVRAFLDALSDGGPRGYHLQTMDFPPRQLTDPEQTIDESGIAYSVLIQRL